MEDNSDIYARLGTDPVTALSPSSMSGGNRISDSSKQTFAAPGSDPVDPLPPQDMLGDTTIGAAAYNTPVEIGPGGDKVNADRADRSDPYSADGGDRWRQIPPKSWGPS